MYERFTDGARKVMRLTQEAAHESHYNYVGTEDILLGLIREGSGVAANAAGVWARSVRIEALAAMQTGTIVTAAGKAHPSVERAHLPACCCHGRPQTSTVWSSSQTRHRVRIGGGSTTRAPLPRN